VVAKVRKKASRKTTRDRKPPRRRRRRRPDERAALLSDVGRRLSKLGKRRIDEIQEMYDAAYAEAQARSRNRARAKGADAGALRARFRTMTEILKSAFALDAIEESQSVADLQLAVATALGMVTNEGDLLPAQVEIGRAFETWRDNARARDRARTYRLRDRLAEQSLAAPITRSDLDAMLAEAERAIALVQADEVKLCSWATAERARATEWTEKAHVARNIGEDDLAAQADARVAQYERQAAEWEAELTNQTAALEKLEDQLAELRRAVAER